MQYLQVTGLPAGFTPTTDLIRGLQLFADVPRAGDVETSNERINRIHRMSYYSITSNSMSVFTDCPGREKLPYGADYVQPMGSLNVNFDYAAYLRNMEVLMSITGVMPNGVMADADVLEADVKRTMLEQAEQSVLLLDESKLSARGRQAIAPVRSVSLVLAPGDAAGRLRELGATARAVRQSP